MKKLFFLLLILASLSSCKKDEEINVYYIELQLKDADGNNNLIKVIQEDPQTVDGNGMKGIDSVSIGFYIGSNNFNDPSREEKTRSFATSISIKIPKEEFNINSRKYEFKNPANFRNYIPSGNLLKEKDVNMFAHLHDNLAYYCVAQLDMSYNNVFNITKAHYYRDTYGNNATDLEGMFTMQFNPSCGSGNKEVISGNFRIKLLLDNMHSRMVEE